MIKSEFNKEKNYLHIEYFGSISPEDMQNLILEIIENKNLPRKLRIMIDSSQAEFNHQISDVDKVVSFLREKISSFDLVMEAMVINKPIETAFSMLYQELTFSLEGKYIHKIFTIKEVALKWLLS